MINHVKRDHQSAVKITLRTGSAMEIRRGDDNTFKCNCGKPFKHPFSLRRHAKECDGELTSPDEEAIDQDISSEENYSDASESIESDDNRVSDIPSHCIG